MFRTKYNRLNDIKTEPGSEFRPVFSSKLDKEKNIQVEQKGQENFYDYIQSFAESCDINLIFAKYAAGDKDALNQRVKEYIDITNIPTNINDFVEYTKNSTEVFKTLPIEVQEMFDNNVIKFMEGMEQKDFSAKLEKALNGKFEKELPTPKPIDKPELEIQGKEGQKVNE